MPLFGHSKPESEATDETSSPPVASGSPDSDALLQHFRELPLAQRAAEVLAEAFQALELARMVFRIDEAPAVT